jgi:hypothetical protein
MKDNSGTTQTSVAFIKTKDSFGILRNLIPDPILTFVDLKHRTE